MAIDLPGRPTIRKLFPHVDAIADPPVQQTVRLLWDRIHDLEERLQETAGAIPVLVAAHETNAAAAATAQTAANAAITLAQLPGGTPTGPPSGGGGGVPPPGPPPGDPGSQTNPIIAMSADPADIAASVRLSRQSYGFGPNPADDQYWIDKAASAEQFSNGKWYQGWNAYWHARANPANTGSADPNLGEQPSPTG